MNEKYVLGFDYIDCLIDFYLLPIICFHPTK